MAGTKRKWPAGMPRRQNANFNRQLIDRSRPSGLPEHLPLVHVTAAWPAQEIVGDRKLVTRHCDVFDADLLYFFVLRPAYRSRYGAEESHQLSRFPVVFVIKPDAIPNPKHIYPFDTGGAAKGAFAKQADKYVQLEDYALENDHKSAVGHIGWAFGTLEAYYEGQLRANIQEEILPFESVISGYVDIARMGVEGSNEHDKRACTIELACGHNVDLPGNLLLVILPKQFLEGNDSLICTLRSFSTDIQCYDWQPNRSPDQYQKEIMNICRDWYRMKGIMA